MTSDDSWTDRLARLAQDHGQPLGPVEDEHERYRLYLALLDADPADSTEGRVLQLVADDPDEVMAQATVVHRVTRVLEASRSPADLAAWCRRHASVLERFPFARSRADEAVRVLSLAADDADDVGAVRSLTAWGQLRLASTATSRTVLRTLAEHGLTKRIRHAASERSRQRKG